MAECVETRLPLVSETTETTLSLARDLATAKRDLGGSEFVAMAREVGLSRAVAYKYATIGECLDLFSPHAQSLPSSYHCLYALRKVDAPTLARWVSEGVVNSQSTVKEVERLVAEQSAPTPVVERMQKLSSMEELGSIRISQSVNHQAFVKELKELVGRYKGLVEWVPSGGMGTRAIRQDALKGEQRAVETFVETCPPSELKAALEAVGAYLGAKDINRRRTQKAKAMVLVETLGSEDRERLASMLPVTVQMLGL